MASTQVMTVALVNAGLVKVDSDSSGNAWASVAWQCGDTPANKALNAFDFNTFGRVGVLVLMEICDITMGTAAGLYANGILPDTPEITGGGCNFGFSIGHPDTDRIVGKVSAALAEIKNARENETFTLTPEGFQRLYANAADLLVSVMAGAYSDDAHAHQHALFDITSNIALCSCYVDQDLAYTALRRVGAKGGYATPSFVAKAVQMADVCAVIKAGEMTKSKYPNMRMLMEPDQFEHDNPIGFLVADDAVDAMFLKRSDVAKGVKGVSSECKYGRCSALFFQRKIVVVVWHAEATNFNYPSVFSNAAEQLIASARKVAKEQFKIVKGQYIPCVLMTDPNLQTSDDAVTAACMMEGSGTYLFNDMCSKINVRLPSTSFETFQKKRNMTGLMVAANAEDAPVACNSLSISNVRPVSTPSFVTGSVYPFECMPIDASFSTTELAFEPTDATILTTPFLVFLFFFAFFSGIVPSLSESFAVWLA